MITDRSHPEANAREGHSALSRLAALLTAALLGGCASGSLSSNETVLSMYVDPARYDLYNCAQLRTAKREQTKRISDVETLMAKAETGAAGSVVAEVTYRGDLNNARANYSLADKVWQRNSCDSEKLPPEKVTTPSRTPLRDPLLPPAPYQQPAPIDQLYQR